MSLRVVRTIEELRAAVAAARAGGKTIGLVPTMGALHAGHAGLIDQAGLETGFVVVSIFVNPAQFGPQEDFHRYPRPQEHDVTLCGKHGTSLVFHPAVETVYPQHYRSFVEVAELQDQLCGKSRPGHFRGVATVVLKLFNMVQPDCAYFGQKDAQQVRIIQQMVHDLNVPVKIIVCPIQREVDGLALSSRNAYLTPEQRRRATVLHRMLEFAQQYVAENGRDLAQMQRTMAAMVDGTEGAKLDYLAIVDHDSLLPVEKLVGTVLVAVAVKFGETRLIDNVVLELP